MADDASRDRLPFTSVGDHLMPGASDTESPDLDARALAAENVALTEELHRVKAREARLERLALHDPLTGLLNCLAFTEALETELARAERGSYPVALVVLDVDLFKQVNDLFGHAVGERSSGAWPSGWRTGCGRATSVAVSEATSSRSAWWTPPRR